MSGKVSLIGLDATTELHRQMVTHSLSGKKEWYYFEGQFEVEGQSPEGEFVHGIAVWYHIPLNEKRRVGVRLTSGGWGFIDPPTIKATKWTPADS